MEMRHLAGMSLGWLSNDLLSFAKKLPADQGPPASFSSCDSDAFRGEYELDAEGASKRRREEDWRSDRWSFSFKLF